LWCTGTSLKPVLTSGVARAYINTHTHTRVYVNVCMHVAVHVINPSLYLDKMPPGRRAGLAGSMVIWGAGGPAQPGNSPKGRSPSPKTAGPCSPKGCVRNKTPFLAPVRVLPRGKRPPRCCLHLPGLPRAPRGSQPFIHPAACPVATHPSRGVFISVTLFL